MKTCGDGAYIFEGGCHRWSEIELYSFMRKLGCFRKNGDDFKLLLDYLGVEIITSPEKRAVVKKADEVFATVGEMTHPFNPGTPGEWTTTTGDVEHNFTDGGVSPPFDPAPVRSWVFSEEQQEKKRG